MVGQRETPPILLYRVPMSCWATQLAPERQGISHQARFLVASEQSNPHPWGNKMVERGDTPNTTG